MSGQQEKNRQQSTDSALSGEMERMATTDAVVVGAGIGGVRAALDLADSGHRVTLIDKSPHMGGLLAKLDHQFPSDGCGMCRMLPTIHRDAATQYCLRRGMEHENINLICNTVLDHVEGEAGNYTLRLRQRKAWVDPQLCTGCGACADVCPVTLPDNFNQGLGTQKAVYLPLPHATPKRYHIDTTHCTRCGECVPACPEKAITLPVDQKKRFRILVVDDELIVRDSVKEWFEFEGYTVEMADSGPKALEMIEAGMGDKKGEGSKGAGEGTGDKGSVEGDGRYALMMLDIKMPGMEGTEVLKRAKALDPDLNVVMMTAYATVQTAVETMQSGALEYIIKPFDPDTLIEKVDRIYQAGVKSDDILSEVSAGALILACGTGYYNPLDGPNTLGYKVLPDVVTGLEYERLLSGSGPTGGKLVRPSTGKPPRRIAWIQCVGSRDSRNGAPYCSSICCMFALKEAVLTRKQYGDAVGTVIYYMDMRCFGKEFEAYKKEAVEKYGVILKRARPHTVRLDSESGRLRIFVAHPDAGLDMVDIPELEGADGASADARSPWKGKTDEVFDMVVLSVGQRPTPETKTLAQMTGIPLNAFGFPETGIIAEGAGDPGSEKLREGIFVGGAFGGGRDIAESVIEASAAASRAMVVLNRYGNKTAGSSGADAVRSSKGNNGDDRGNDRGKGRGNDRGNDRGKGRGNDRGNDQGNDPGKSPLGLTSLTPLIPSEVNLTTRLAAFQEPKSADGRSKNGKDPSIQPLDVLGRVLVIGGGVAGLTAALSVADAGYRVVLVEKAPEIGGNLQWIGHNIEGADFNLLLGDLTEKITKHPMITLYKRAEVTACSGEVGNFQSTVIIASDGAGTMKETVSHGAVIVATGAMEATPQGRDSGLYGLGEHKAVTTLKGLSLGLNRHEQADGGRAPGAAPTAGGNAAGKNAAGKNAAGENAAGENARGVPKPNGINPTALDTVVMIQCVGCRDENKPYCSRVCCTASLKHALALKKINPAIQIYILYRDMMTYGFSETYYDEARRNDIIFIQYSTDALPKVTFESSDPDPSVDGKGDVANDMTIGTEGGNLSEVGGVTVTIHDPIIDRDVAISADLLVLATGMTPNGTGMIPNGLAKGVEEKTSDPTFGRDGSVEMDSASLFGIERDGYGFFKQGDSKWRPVDSTREGIFLCGTAMGPRNVDESMASARAAAMRALRIVSQDRLKPSAVTAGVKTSLCSLCMKCVETCPYDARRFDEARRLIAVNAAVCQGCGACAAVCPNSASYLTEFSDQQMFERIDTAIGYYS